MGFMPLIQKIALLFLLISVSFLSMSCAGRPSTLVKGALHEPETRKQKRHDEEMMSHIHEKLLKVNTKDYGRYDPSPALVKPPSKPIKN